jgi:hypothetical protein
MLRAMAGQRSVAPGSRPLRFRPTPIAAVWAARRRAALAEEREQIEHAFASNVLVQLEQTAAREAIAMTHAEAAPGS